MKHAIDPTSYLINTPPWSASLPPLEGKCDGCWSYGAINLRLDSTARMYWALLEAPMPRDSESCYWSPLSLLNFPPESLFPSQTLNSSLAEQHTVMCRVRRTLLLG
jgi:hypothetical protein